MLATSTASDLLNTASTITGMPDQIRVADVRRAGWPAVAATRVGLPDTHAQHRRDWHDGDDEVMLLCGGLGVDASPEQLRDWAQTCFAIFDEGTDCAILPNWPDRTGAQIAPSSPTWCGLTDHPHEPYLHLVSIRHAPKTNDEHALAGQN